MVYMAQAMRLVQTGGGFSELAAWLVSRRGGAVWSPSSAQWIFNRRAQFMAKSRGQPAQSDTRLKTTAADLGTVQVVGDTGRSDMLHFVRTYQHTRAVRREC